jgi:ParB family transcriptional regulator, chromosome partitioning protein
MTKRALLKDQKVFLNLFQDEDTVTDKIEPLFDSTQAQSVMWIKMKDIRPNPHQPRSNFDPEKLAELAESIKKKGLLQAITVRQQGDCFEIIAGERRFRACKLLGMTEIPAMVRNDVDDLGTLEIALIENLQREDLTPLEEARIYSRMLKELHYTQEQLSKTLSKSQQYINDRLQLLSLSPNVQDKIQQRKLSLSKARKIATIKNYDLQKEVSEKVLEEGLNARQTEQLVKITKVSAPESISRKPAQLCNRLSKLFKQAKMMLQNENLPDLDKKEKAELKKAIQEFQSHMDMIYEKLC